MEGPTPVSSLLHAATMVTAGVFLVIRCSIIFEYSEFTLLLLLLFGAITSVFAGVVALFQFDLKKIIAYSTCSQLGYMFFSCGLSNYYIAFFHL
jgi:NADH:ubiquinone oxidoreductase subunit 5 (subunit L)/multisubunit Na+/H+ antiporter MnhA subunit